MTKHVVVDNSGIPRQNWLPGCRLRLEKESRSCWVVSCGLGVGRSDFQVLLYQRDCGGCGTVQRHFEAAKRDQIKNYDYYSGKSKYGAGVAALADTDTNQPKALTAAMTKERP